MRSKSFKDRVTNKRFAYKLYIHMALNSTQELICRKS